MLTTWSVRRRLTLLAGLTALAGCLVAAVVITMLAHLVLTDYRLEQAAAARAQDHLQRGELRPLSVAGGSHRGGRADPGDRPAGQDQAGERPPAEQAAADPRHADG
ncbi:hypothetical protein [Nonomuraea dietziae]|uniref:hypothetical protein n=1 Tax=Nonomuraea dietziae TaxID=65515 RepID=UPI0031D67407